MAVVSKVFGVSWVFGVLGVLGVVSVVGAVGAVGVLVALRVGEEALDGFLSDTVWTPRGVGILSVGSQRENLQAQP